MTDDERSGGGAPGDGYDASLTTFAQPGETETMTLVATGAEAAQIVGPTVACALAAPPEALPSNAWATPATVEEVVEFVERVRPRESQVRRVASAPPPPVGPPCQWENCTAPSTASWRWRREAADGVRDAFDTAAYCDSHANIAETLGAVRVIR